MFIFPGVITVEDFLTYPLLLFSQTDYNDKVNVAKDVVNSVTSRGDIFSKYNFSYNGMGFLFSLDDDAVEALSLLNDAFLLLITF